MPNEESQGPSCSILSRLKDSVNTVRCSVDSKLLNAKFVSYNNWIPPPSRLCDVTHVTLPGLPPLFLHTASNQKLEVGTAWQ